MRRSASLGASLVELLVAIAVLSILFAMSYAAYRSVRERNALDTDTQEVLAELGEARSLTLSGKSGSAWGLHIASSSITLFEGSSYADGASGNVETSLTPGASVSAIALLGGGSDIVFQKLTGATGESGTVTLSLDASSTQLETIHIYPSGVAQLQ